jgi:hypothetical protein
MRPCGCDCKGKSIILNKLNDAFKLKKKNKYMKLIENIPIDKLNANKMVKILNKLVNMIHKKKHCRKEDNKKLYKLKYKKEMNNVYNLLSPLGFTIFIDKVDKL